MDEWVSFDALGEAQSQLLGAVHTSITMITAKAHSEWEILK